MKSEERTKQKDKGNKSFIGGSTVSTVNFNQSSTQVTKPMMFNTSMALGKGRNPFNTSIDLTFTAEFEKSRFSTNNTIVTQNNNFTAE
jgi:hypothetical protein